MQISKKIAEVVSNFKCTANAGSHQTYGSGHINDTFILRSSTNNGSDYILQRINHRIFDNVEQLTNNMRLVTEHLKNKIIESGNGNPDTEVMTLVPTKKQNFFYRDTDGDYWRMFYFLADTKSYDVVETPKQAYQGGRAFGKFQYLLSDIPADTLFEVIPDFHNIQKRLAQLEKALSEDPLGRSITVAKELAIVNEFAQAMQFFQHPQQLATLPKRVIHNDTKFNNVLLNAHDEAQCVIDLETVMDGYVAYDFGDAIRTIINTCAEDEANLSEIKLNMPLFEAYVKGYIQEAVCFLTDSEVQSLMKGALLLPYMQAVRFLTDYINGDVYFKIKFKEHNLQRAKAQFKLFQLLKANEIVMHQIILTEVNNYRKAAHDIVQ